MTATHVPAVSVGMPAYNSERTIRASIDSLLGQDFADLELIISDNGSTDGTWPIIQAYAARDRRVVAIRQPHNLGANGNYSAVARAARGRYFKWASSNDLCASDFVSRCVAALEADPGAVLAMPRTRLFAESPADGTDYDGDIDASAADPVERLRHVTQTLRLNNVMNGVVRRQALMRTRLIEHHRGADIVLIAHLALLGRFVLLDQRLFWRRMEAQTATRLMDAEAVERHHHPTRTARSLFPNWRVATGQVQAVLEADLDGRQRRRALAWVARLAFWNAGSLRRDVADALRFSLGR